MSETSAPQLVIDRWLESARLPAASTTRPVGHGSSMRAAHAFVCTLYLRRRNDVALSTEQR